MKTKVYAAIVTIKRHYPAFCTIIIILLYINKAANKRGFLQKNIARICLMAIMLLSGVAANAQQVTEQPGNWRWRNNDGNASAAGATWMAPLNTRIILAPDNTNVIRLRWQMSSGGNYSTQQIFLEYMDAGDITAGPNGNWQYVNGVPQPTTGNSGDGWDVKTPTSGVSTGYTGGNSNGIGNHAAGLWRVIAPRGSAQYNSSVTGTGFGTAYADPSSGSPFIMAGGAVCCSLTDVYNTGSSAAWNVGSYNAAATSDDQLLPSPTNGYSSPTPTNVRRAQFFGQNSGTQGTNYPSSGSAGDFLTNSNGGNVYAEEFEFAIKANPANAPLLNHIYFFRVTAFGKFYNNGVNAGGVPPGYAYGSPDAAYYKAPFPYLTIVQCSGFAVSASSNKSLVCPSSPGITLTSTPSGGTTPYTYLWSGSGVSPTNTQNTSATPTVSGTYTVTVTVTDNQGCTAQGATGTVTYDNPVPSIVAQCVGAAVKLVDANNINAATWTWTTTSGGRFYKNAIYDVATDSATSHLPGPYITIKGSYTLTVVDGNGCAGTDTKTITAGSCGTVLASNMPGVTAQRHGSSVQLQWGVTNESTVKGYVIERSADGSAFTTTGLMQAVNAGSHTYSFTDDVALIGCIKLYYRIKQTNADGVSYYSNIMPVNCNANDANEYVFKVYPNPVVTGNLLTVSYSLPAGVSKAQLIITNTISGRQYSYVINSTNSAVNNTTIPVNGSMAAGAYFIQLVSHKWVSKTIKIIKQ